MNLVWLESSIWLIPPWRVRGAYGTALWYERGHPYHVRRKGLRSLRPVPQDTASARPRESSLVDDRCPVHKQVDHTGCILVRPIKAAPIADGLGIENDDIGE